MSGYVYEWREDTDKFSILRVASKEDRRGLMMKGKAHCQTLDRPIQLERVEDNGRLQPLADLACTGMSQPKFVSERGWQAISKFLSGSGSDFPAVVVDSGDPYRIWFPDVVADCLVEDQSEFFESLSDYRSILKAVFNREIMPEDIPFTVKNFERHQVWVHKHFVTAARNAKLTGGVFSRKARVVVKTSIDH